MTRIITATVIVLALVASLVVGLLVASIVTGLTPSEMESMFATLKSILGDR